VTDGKAFFKLISREARPDYLAIHIYTTTFDSFRNLVEKYWETFGLPIWVTEFAMQVSTVGQLLMMVC
jgi:hypothetical protein